MRDQSQKQLGYPMQTSFYSLQIKGMNNMIYWFENSGNNVFRNHNFTFLLSAKSSHENGFFVRDCNYRDSIGLFASRSLPKHTWINDQDRYSKPLISNT